MLKVRQKFGKYVIEGRLAEGGFAAVYRARDTIEGIRVALKIPYANLMSDDVLDNFRHEVRIAARLEHPNILPLKYADFIEGRFVIVTALGECSLEDRLQKRISVSTALTFARQMLAATAWAHEHRIIHCDIKPDNFLIFPNNLLRLADFGIARVAQRTLQGSGAETVGYIAPEQAMGKPSFRSDVFSLGVIFYRMFSGHLPEWPYRWPMPGHDRLRGRLHPKLIALIRRAIEVEGRKRFHDAGQMLDAFREIKSPTRTSRSKSRKLVAVDRTRTSNGKRRKWDDMKFKEFQRQFGKELETRHVCSSCDGPVAECMLACPWCGKSRQQHQGEIRFSVYCPRCHRGLKADWHYCPWCYGPGFEPSTNRQLTDRRYRAKCRNERCERQELMPFMRYCPWCNRRVSRKWKIAGGSEKCSRCGWGILPTYWNHCPWCSKKVTH